MTNICIRCFLRITLPIVPIESKLCVDIKDVGFCRLRFFKETPSLCFSVIFNKAGPKLWLITVARAKKEPITLRK